MHTNFSKIRQFSIFFLVISVFLALFGRLLYIQIITHKDLSKIAGKQHKIFVKLEPRRGNIYDRQKRVLAVYLDVLSIYAVPKEIKDKEKTSRVLSREFGVEREVLSKRLAKDNYFAWVKRKVDDKTVKKVKELDLEGVYLIKERKRFYPGGRLACQVLGLTGIDNEGLEGLELFYDRELKGEPGWRRSLRDAKQREIVSFQLEVLPARDGKSLVLTIDEVIQHTIEKEIENIVKLYKPEACSIVAMVPDTGEILGMATYPWFDPNVPSKANMDFVRNRAISDSFEPGSVFKVITASAALEEGVVDFDTKFFCENGAYRVGKRTLHDYHSYGDLTFREVIEKSSNIGTAKVASKLGKDKLTSYIRKFNFASVTGIDLPGEAMGIMRDPDTWSYVDMTTVPMGQGIAVTTIQLGVAVSAIANGGVLMKPYIVKELLSEDGSPIKENAPKALRRVISEETSRKVRELMFGVVESGTGRRAKMKDYPAGGKTGTAQKVNPNGGYYKKKYIASFLGFAPYENPEVVLVVNVDDPRRKHFGGTVAAPAFKNIMKKILSYMDVERDLNEGKPAT